ncbi:MAG: pyruvate kinase alpha/beta domain-containing protein, partial [Planctomycetota bacterium]
MEEKTVYFEQPGQENTAAVFDVVDRALSELDIHKVVLASTRGDTARFAMDWYEGQDVRLVVVPHQYGFGPGQRFPQELVERARREGHEVMLFHQEKIFGQGPAQWVANFLRAFCQGVKVCVEILLMAGNAGLVQEGEQVVVVAGTGRGADTALVMTGATSG